MLKYNIVSFNRSKKHIFDFTVGCFIIVPLDYNKTDSRKAKMIMDKDFTKIKDRIYGVIFGQAIGDALGLGTEFMSKREVLRSYPNGLEKYEQIVDDSHRRRWKKGDWTDDTDMMLCIARSMIAEKYLSYQAVAFQFKKWFLSSPLGIGCHTHKVLSLSDYTSDPLKAAEIIWELSRRESAANGALMRTSVVGLWPKDVRKNAELICRITHADPRCVASCVILSELIHAMVWHDEEIPFHTLLALGADYDKQVAPFLTLAKESAHLDLLELDHEASMGYTLKTLSAALWCLYHTESFKDGLQAVVNAGGDADTNAAVACSLLGAKYGYGSIPNEYIEQLVRNKELRKVASDLSELCISVYQHCLLQTSFCEKKE